MSKKITFTGLRHENLSALFELSPIRKSEGRLRMPFVIVTPDGLHMRATNDASLLLEASDDCYVICVWPGKKRNDIFRFTVAQFLDHIKEHPKKEGQVI